MSSSTFESPIDSLAGTIFTYSELDLHMPANRLPNCWLAGRAARRPGAATDSTDSGCPINSLLVHHYDGFR